MKTGILRDGERIALFHPAFECLGGAEILVATQAQYLRSSGTDVRVATLAFESRFASLLEGVPLRVAEHAPWLDRLRSEAERLARAVPRVEALLADYETIMAVNFPCNVLLGAATTRARKLWCCTEPSRYWHLVATSPYLHLRHATHPTSNSDVERAYARRLLHHARQRKTPEGARLIEFDLEMTRKLDAIYSISEFARDTMKRVYGRSDDGIIYPMVRFPDAVTHRRSGLDRTGLRVLTHSRLETAKNVENVLRGFAVFRKAHAGAKLSVVGEGPARKRLEKLAVDLGLSGAVRFHGYLPDEALAAVYAASDVFALQPIDEPFGMVFPEAASRGLLLVGPDHGGPLEILDGGRLGEVTDPFAPESLAEALHRIWALSDAEVDARRMTADQACRSRYSVATIGPVLRRVLEHGNR
jgi:glycosyltransferase involved in cell wall biosynthesis